MDVEPLTLRLLRRVRSGDELAAQELLPLIYDELHRMAAAHMRGQRRDSTLQATALINEAWLRLAQGAQPDWQDRAHFLHTASRAMRNALIDHERARRAAKRSAAGTRITLAGLLCEDSASGLDLLTLSDSLDRLEALDPELGKLVELRFFAGLEIEEVARVLDTSPSRIDRRWKVARMWLRRELDPSGAHGI